MGMNGLAKHVLAVADKKGLEINNTHLQKILFFTIGMYMREVESVDRFVRRTCDVPFERWKYGPVVENVYFKYNTFGKRAIVHDEVEDDRYTHLNEIIERLLVVDEKRLIAVSQQMDAWSVYREEILNRRYVPPYELEEVLMDFLVK